MKFDIGAAEHHSYFARFEQGSGSLMAYCASREMWPEDWEN